MKRILLLLATLFSMASTPAQSWLDVTEQFVKNPNFDGNIDGWTDGYAQAAQNHGYQSASYWNGESFLQGFAEAWRPSDWWRANNLGDASISQQLTNIPAGRYRLEADAIAANQGNTWTDVSGAFLFLTDGKNEATTSLHTGDGQPEHFTVEYTSSATTLTIGVRTESTTANWLAFDNVRLYWYGSEVKVTSVSLDHSSATLTQGEQLQLQATVKPDNALFKELNFESSNEATATVSPTGLVTARHPGITTITATSAHYPNVLARCIITVEANQVTADAVIFNEVQQANIDMFLDPSFNYGGWVELYNSTAHPVLLDGLYLSDDASDLRKMALITSRHGSVPAHGFLTLWFDHYSRWAPAMMTFKLDADGGNLYLSDESGTILSQMAYPPAIARTSYARTADGGATWNYTDQPTPSASNNSTRFAAARLAAPVTDTPAGFFTQPFTVKVNIPDGATLRYTTDGSVPTPTNGQVSSGGIFSISATTILRLRYFSATMLASPVVTYSYIYKDKDYTLPVISLVADQADLYGQDHGIFARGNGNGRPGNGQATACNWNMEWDRGANIEYFNPEGTAVFSQEVGIEASGGWSRAWGLHAFNIKANKVYEGRNRMDYPFFENKPFLRHKALKVRSGGNDQDGRIKDAAIQEVVRTSGLNIETQSYKPVHVFHNGQYIGVQNLREPNNKNYGYANYGIGTDDTEMDQWKMSPDSGYVQQVGTRDVFDEWYTLAQNAADALAYERIRQIVDIESYINYMAVELYIAGTDWPKNNIKSFRERSEGQSNSRFRFVLFDTDGAFAANDPFTWFESTQTWTFDQLYGVSDLYPSGRITKEIEFTTIFLNMLKNDDFRRQFADQFCIVAGSVFEPSRAADVIQDMVAYVNPAMSLEGRSASSSANSVVNYFSASRQSSHVAAMRNFLGIGETAAVGLSANIPEATLCINGLQVPTGKFSGQLLLPATLQATAPAGYRFLGWQAAEGATVNTLFTLGSQWEYYDRGSLDAQEWQALNYTATNWKRGLAPLGYFTTDAQNQRGYNTFLDYGGNDSSKHPTYYFRKDFNIATSFKASDTFTLQWVADDGFVVYVNGKEAGRYLMDNTPAPTFSDYADTYAPANPERGTIAIKGTFFKRGKNVIAVEVHNNAANSTDIYWDAQLSHTAQASGSYISTDPTFELQATSHITLQATFEPMSATELASSDAHPVKINEVSAANDIYVSDLYKKSDWIELYNTTDQDIDLEGMFLSDHLDQPEKWQITAGTEDINTILPAHGHLVIWADKTAGNSQLHADFKLNNADSCLVLLTAADHSWADTLVYCSHDGYHSVGLFPDGGSDLYVMERPTIGQANVITTAATVWSEPSITLPEPVDVRITGTTDDNLLALRSDGNALHLQGASRARLDIFTPAGQLVYTATIHSSSPITLTSLPCRGICIARATTDDDQTTLKLTINN